jgi:recombination protein RecA
MVEIFGPESSGKSLLTLYLIASAQRSGLECLLVDAEQSFDPHWAAMHGVDVDKLFIGRDFDGGEQALEWSFQAVKSGAFGLVVIDSTAALTPIKELEGSLEDEAIIGIHARMMSRGCRKICGACGKTNTTAVFINQVRTDIGKKGGFGVPETTPGGKALRFYSHQRMRVSKFGQIKAKENGEDVVVGQVSRVKFVKNKVGRPYGQCEFEVVFDKTALNPVVMLSNMLYAHKLVTVYGGIYRIPANILDNTKPIVSGGSTMAELADFLISEDIVIDMLELLQEKIDEDLTSEEKIDGKILEMLEDASKIASPSDDDNPFKASLKKVEDGVAEDSDDSHVNEAEIDPEVIVEEATKVLEKLEGDEADKAAKAIHDAEVAKEKDTE